MHLWIRSGCDHLGQIKASDLSLGGDTVSEEDVEDPVECVAETKDKAHEVEMPTS